MRLKTDENFPERAVALLREHGHDVDTVADEQLRGSADAIVAEEARRAGRMVITLDRGFPGHAARNHPGIIVIRLASQAAPVVEAAIAELLNHQDLDSLTGCIVIVELGRIRVRWPEP